jgi:membrane fusion protein, macrolide-specific efflux system
MRSRGEGKSQPTQRYRHPYRQTLLRRLLVGAGVVVVVVIVLFGPLLLSRFTKPQQKPALATVERQSFYVVARGSGVLQPSQYLNVNFGIAGQVTAIYVRVGQNVAKGMLLAKLDDSRQQAALIAAHALVSSGEQVLVVAEASGSNAAIASAQSQVASAKLQLVLALQAEAATSLIAPEAGTILAVNGGVGNVVLAGGIGPPVPGATNGSETFIAIGSGTNFVVWAPFSESDTARLRVGQTGTVSGFAALPGLNPPCEVAFIAASATPVNGVPMFYVESTIGAPDLNFRNGYTATVNIDVAKATDVLAVPTQALFTNANGAFQVDVLYQGTPVATTVTLGLSGDTLTQITSGLLQGQQVMLSPVGQTLPSSPSPT